MFYSFCIQSSVRKCLLKFMQGTTNAGINCAKMSIIGPGQYLHLPVRLFIASSGTHDPLVADLLLSINTTSPQEEDCPGAEDYRDAQLAVRQAEWNSHGITTSAEYLSHLFEDVGEILETSNALFQFEGSTISMNSPVENTTSMSGSPTSSSSSIHRGRTFEAQHGHMVTYRDEEAAAMVKSHIMRDRPHSTHERILRNLIESYCPIDDDTLDSILLVADIVFSNGALHGRVRWEWSHPSQSCYQTEIIGTTALRPCTQGGYKALIVLSAPILKKSDYDRRLLWSAFLHELVHCYLYVRCGMEVRVEGGHTVGFHTIAAIIDKWAGGHYLRLCDMKANLNHSRKDQAAPLY